MTSKAPDTRVYQAISLLAGALFLAIVVAPDDSRFYWTPLTLGLAYLGAAIAGGRDGGHWATACALTGWGLAVVYAGAVRPDLDTAGLYLVGAGLGVTTGLLLQRAGFAVDALGLAITVTAAGGGARAHGAGRRRARRRPLLRRGRRGRRGDQRRARPARSRGGRGSVLRQALIAAESRSDTIPTR